MGFLKKWKEKRLLAKQQKLQDEQQQVQEPVASNEEVPVKSNEQQLIESEEEEITDNNVELNNNQPTSEGEVKEENHQQTDDEGLIQARRDLLHLAKKSFVDSAVTDLIFTDVDKRPKQLLCWNNVFKDATISSNQALKQLFHEKVVTLESKATKPILKKIISYFRSLKDNYDVVYDNKLKSYNLSEKAFLQCCKALSIRGKKRLDAVVKKTMANYEEYKALDESFSSLSNEISTAKRDNDALDLFIAYPFVYGGYKPKTSKEDSVFAVNNFCAPLLLWKANIFLNEKNNPVIKLVLHDEKPVVQINSELFINMCVTINNKLIIPKFELDFDGNFDNLAKNVIDLFKQSGVTISNEQENNLKKIFVSLDVSSYFDTKETKEMKLNKNVRFNIENKCILGLFDTSLKATEYLEYKKMLSGNGPRFFNVLNHRYYDQLSLFKKINSQVKETEVRQILPLDYSQKRACYLALNDSLIIQGPPGTGKTQTITNIIANLINQLRSSLLITEKKTASEVIFNRLGRLRNYSLKLFESDNLNIQFTNQIKTGIERIGRLFGLQDVLNSVEIDKNISNDLDSAFNRVNNFKNIMTSKIGHLYPKFNLEFAKIKDSILPPLNLIKHIIPKFKNEQQFWAYIKDVSDDINTFQSIKSTQTYLNVDDETFIDIISLAPNFTNNDVWYKQVLVRSIVGEGEGLVPTPEQLEKIKKLTNAFKRLSLGKLQEITQKPVEWYKQQLLFSSQTDYANVKEFIDNYMSANFDFNMARNLLLTTDFINKNLSELKVDNENWDSEIEDGLKGKLKEDIIQCEINFILNMIKVFNEDEHLYNEYNRLYSYVATIEVIDNIPDFLVNFSEILSLCFPSIIASPSYMFSVIPTQRALFDYVIIDEASQITLEKAIPILYRGRYWIVGGDKRQLQPDNVYTSKLLNTSTKTKEKVFISNPLDKYPCVLDYIDSKIQTCLLNYHYRAKNKQLIQFSNMKFYNGTMCVTDAPNKTNNGIHLINVKGKYENHINKVEADKVINIVHSIVHQPYHGTIGVICFSRHQSEYILERLRNHKDKRVVNELFRINNNGENVSLFVKSVSEVQGDERDNIIISVAYSSSTDSKSLAENFNVLNKNNSKNRINTMISRAKENMWIIKSFDSNQIVGDFSEGVSVFKDFLVYCEFLNKYKNINSPEVKALLDTFTKDVVDFDFANDLIDKGSNWLQKSISDILTEILSNKYNIVTNRYEGKTKIDISIVDKKTDSTPLAIICDDFQYDLSVSSKERDYYAEDFLRTFGWKFYRITSLKWSKPENHYDIILDLLTKLSQVTGVQVNKLANLGKLKKILSNDNKPSKHSSSSRSTSSHKKSKKHASKKRHVSKKAKSHKSNKKPVKKTSKKANRRR